MEDELNFLPWWIRYQRWVISGVALVIVSGLGGWFYAEFHRAKDARRCDPKAEAEAAALDEVPAAETVVLEPGGDFQKLGESRPGQWRHEFNEPPQCFSDWLGRKRQDVTEERRTLYLQPIGEFDAEMSPDLEILAEFGRLYFGLPVVVREPIDPGELELRKRTRGNGRPDKTQWLTDDVLAALKEHLPDDAYAMLGLTMTDLWPGGGWNFVFGQAMLSERVGIYSFARYDPGPEHTGADHHSGLDRERLNLLRAMKVMSHETGHMFGISHCLHYQCNMNGSNSLPETDSQPIHLCPVDLKKLRHAVGFDIVERYRKLAAFFERHGLVEQAQFARRRLQSPGAQ